MQPSPIMPSPALVRRIALLGVVLAVVLAVTGGYMILSGRSDAGPSIGGPFSLVDGDGRLVTDRNFRGKFTLVYFGYTFCPDVCPMTLTAVADAMERLGSKADRVQPIFITVDPLRDTQQVVKQYAATFSSHLIGLTGPADAIARAARAYRVYYAPHVAGSGPDDYTIDHSSILYLMGPDGSFIAPIPARESGAQMAAQIGRFIS